MAEPPSALRPQRILGSKKGFYKVSFAPRPGDGADNNAGQPIPEPAWMLKESVPKQLVDTWRALRTERASFRQRRSKSREPSVYHTTELTNDDSAHDETHGEPVASAVDTDHYDAAEDAEASADVSAERVPELAPTDASEAVHLPANDTGNEVPDTTYAEDPVAADAPRSPTTPVPGEENASAPAPTTGSPSTLTIPTENSPKASAAPQQDPSTTPPIPTATSSDTERTPRKEGILTSAVAAIRATFQSTPSRAKETPTPEAPTPTGRRPRRPVGSSTAFTPQSSTVEGVTQEAQELIHTLSRRKDQLQEEVEFVRTMYQEASSSASNLSTDLSNAKKEIALLKKQLTDGLALQQQFVDAQQRQYEDQIAVLSAQLELFQGQSAQTSAEIRRKAAEWDMHLEREREEAEQRQKQWAKWDERRKRDGLYYAGDAAAPPVAAPMAPTNAAVAEGPPVSAADALSQELAELAADANEAGIDLNAPRSRRRRAPPASAEPAKRARTDVHASEVKTEGADTVALGPLLASESSVPPPERMRTGSVPVGELCEMPPQRKTASSPPAEPAEARWLRRKRPELPLDSLPTPPSHP